MNELSDILDVQQMLLWLGLMIAALAIFALVISRLDPRTPHAKPVRQPAHAIMPPAPLPVSALDVLKPSLEPQLSETPFLNPT